MEDNKVFRISTYGYSVFEEKIAKLNRRAKRLKAKPIQLTILGQETETDKNGTVTIYNLVTVEGDRPRINGWAFAGTLQHTGGNNIIHAVPNMTIPTQYREAKPVCAHCKASRFRIHTYILVNDNGDFMQVGRNCLADFLGTSSPQGLASYCELLTKAVEEAEEATSHGYWIVPLEHRFYDLKEYMPFVAQAIMSHGWVSRANAREYDRQSTSSKSWIEYLMQCHGMRRPQGSKPMEVTEEAKDLANKAIEWAVGLSARQNLTDYLYNLHTLASQNIVDHKTGGLIASLVNAYKLDGEFREKQEKEAKAKSASKHFGTIGKREVYELTVNSIIYIDSFYGVTKLHKMTDKDGNVAVWFSSTKTLEEGKTYKLKATVKDHTNYNGTKQTDLSRCVEV